MVREGLAEKVTIEEKLEGGEGVFQAEGLMTSAWGLTREPAWNVVRAGEEGWDQSLRAEGAQAGLRPCGPLLGLYASERISNRKGI